ncbi:hypothetical protein E3N88_24907 [Mikania micrantha]|uniref:F-box domain-containing protein n=1 Tax=Mikania micrantha TaxID=192012 RepID=A0A5N6N374_9ASTR|nr:hypothetical protein E3N88_24907 [Mikania micrantha]
MFIDMADFHIPDDIICNIVAWLPTKPLVRFFQCVSKYWNRRLCEPNFMKLRSRKMIFLPTYENLKLIDDNVPSDNTSDLIVERCHPFDTKLSKPNVIGAFSGVVLLAWREYFVLYNPFTGATKQLPRLSMSFGRIARGFGYGATPDDLKIFRICQDYNTCDVYNFREGSWSRLNTSKYHIMYLYFKYNVGHFVNGFLYWIAYFRSMLIAINVNDMVISEICLPFQIGSELILNPLGTMDGYLCSLQPITNGGFDMWVMKEENQWSIIYSFQLAGLPLNDVDLPYCAIRILERRRILMWNPHSGNLIIYDTSKASYKTLNISIEGQYLDEVQALEYVETLVSPLDMCFETTRRKCKGNKRRNNKKKRVF